MALAGAIGLMGTIGNPGGFAGSMTIGALKQESDGYATSMAALAFGLILGAVIVLILGRSMARQGKFAEKIGGAR
jgi:nitrate/nitrite transporter NarK